MFERFTDRARRVIVLAQDEARQYPDIQVRTIHTLLGMIGEGEGVAFQVLTGLGVTRDAALEKAHIVVAPANAALGGYVPFSPATQKLCEVALREALNLGHNYIGTEHLLLAAVRESEQFGAASVLGKLGHQPLEVREAVLGRLSSYPDPKAPRPLPGPSGVIRYRSDPSPAEVLAVAREVAERLTDLEGYIEKRSAEQSAPALAAAATAMEAALARIADNRREYGHQIDALTRQLDGTRAELAAVRQDRDHLKEELDRRTRDQWKEHGGA